MSSYLVTCPEGCRCRGTQKLSQFWVSMKGDSGLNTIPVTATDAYSAMKRMGVGNIAGVYPEGWSRNPQVNTAQMLP